MSKEEKKRSLFSRVGDVFSGAVEQENEGAKITVEEIENLFAIFDVEVDEGKVARPKTLGNNVAKQEWEKYRVSITQSTITAPERQQKYSKITREFSNFINPGQMRVPPQEGHRQLLNLRYEGHAFDGIVEQRNGETLLYMIDRGKDIIGNNPDRGVKAKRHVVKQIPEGHFASVMSDLSSFSKLDRDSARRKYQETVAHLPDVQDTPLDNLKVKGFKGAHCATLQPKSSLRVLMNLEFGHDEGETIYKSFSKGRRLENAKLLEVYQSKEEFVQDLQNISKFSDEELGKLYDKVNDVTKSINTRYNQVGGEINLRANDFSYKNRVVQDQDYINTQFGKLSHDINNLSKVGAKIGQSGCSVINNLLDYLEGKESLTVNGKNGNAVEVSKDDLLLVKSALEKRLFDQQFSKAMKINKSGGTRIEEHNFADVVTSKANENASDIAERLADKLKMDKSVINREALDSEQLKGACERISNAIDAVKSQSRGVVR